jgi:hypothetical protein
MVKKMQKTVIVMLLLAALIGWASAEGWGGYVTTNTSSWQISRHSENITMDISGYVEGTVSPVECRGRVLSPYAYYLKDVSLNGADIKERTAAYQGMYKAEDVFKLRSRISSVGYELTKPAGTSVWTAEFYADWPVKMNSSRSIDYIGRNINDREYIGNGEDNVRESFLYNMKFTKEQHFNLSARSLNATIFATDDQILNAYLDENKDLDYGLDVHSTGIADLGFKQSSRSYQVESGSYAPLSESEERYVGDYHITRKLAMKSNYSINKEEADSWLPCCSNGWANMNPLDQVGHSAESVFDCTCFKTKGT